MALSPNAGADRLDAARSAAVDQAVASLEAAMAAQPERFAAVKRVAVLPVQDDPNGRLTELLTVGVTKTSLGVMARTRSELETLLQEHKFAGDDYEDLFNANKETVARLGEFLGVDAYLMARVAMVEDSDLTARVTLGAKLVQIETAQILWADSVTGEIQQPSKAYEERMAGQRRTLLLWGIGAVVVLIALVAWGVAFSRRPPVVSEAEVRSEAEELLRQDHALRTRLGAEVARAQANLDQARRKANEAGRAAQADRLRGLDNRLATLKRSVEGASFGAGPATTPKPGAVRRLADFERALDQDLKTLAGRCEGVAHALIDSAQADVDKDLDRVEKDMAAFEGRFAERRDYLKGLL
jgi:TolB-like protein